MKECAPEGSLIKIVKNNGNSSAMDVIFKNIGDIDDQLDQVDVYTIHGQQTYNAGELYLRYNPQYTVEGDLVIGDSATPITRLLAIIQRTN